MRLLKTNLLIVLFGICLIAFWFVTPMTAAVSEDHPNSFSEWIRMLPKEKLLQVEIVLENNLDCLGNSEEGVRPDMGKWKENVCQGLKDILTPEELKVFAEFLTPKRQDDHLSTTASTCDDCGSAGYKLNQAYGYLNSAYTAYNTYHSSYCDFGIGPDSVEIYIGLAIYYTDTASQNAYIAYNTCDCNSAVQAVYDTRKARTYTNIAWKNTYYDCGGAAAPWEAELVSAKNYIASALLVLENGCHTAACL